MLIARRAKLASPFLLEVIDGGNTPLFDNKKSKKRKLTGHNNLKGFSFFLFVTSYNKRSISFLYTHKYYTSPFNLRLFFDYHSTNK